MTFPTTPLDTRSEFQIAGVWTDVSQSVYTRDPITIVQGSGDEATRTDPGRCTLTLNNRDGKFSPRNPMSPYYGSLGRNTPLRISVPGAESYLALDGTPAATASTPDAAPLDITGDLDVRIEASVDWYATRAHTLIGKWDAAGGQRSWRLNLENGAFYLYISTTGANTLWAGLALPALPPRAALRATLDVDNGAGGWTAVLYWAESLAGPWTPLGPPIVVSGVTSLFNSSAPLLIAPTSTTIVPNWTPTAGRIHRAEVRNGIDGTIVASPDFRALTEGTTSFTDTAGRAWTVNSPAQVSNRDYRFTGEVSSWPSRWDASGKDVWAPIEAAGILRRLGQGRKPLSSTLARRIPSAPGLIAYWPMEEGPRTTQAYSPVQGVRPLRATGLDWAADDTLSGSSPLPKVKSPATLNAVVPRGTTAGWQVEMTYFLPAMPTVQSEILRVTVAGSVMDTAVVYASTAGIRIEARDSDDTVVAFFTYTNAAALTDFTGIWNRLQIYTSVSGGTTSLMAAWRDIAGGTYWVAQTTFTGTMGAVTGISGKWGTAVDGMALGHLSVAAVAGSALTAGSTIYNNADTGFNGESALARLARLGEEELRLGLSWIVGDPTVASERLGPQRPETILTLLEQCADTDGGILYERRDGLGLVYRDRASLYGQDPVFALDYTASEVALPLEPTEDDQRVRNDVTVTRSGGGSGRVVIEEGPLSVLPPEEGGVGIYDEALTLSLAVDDQTAPIAAWKAYLGTWDEARYPTVHIQLHTAPRLAPDTARLRIGDMARITNPPPWLAPGNIDFLVYGYTETIDQYTWDIFMNTVPAGPWRVGVLEDPVVSRADTDGAQLAAGITDTAATLSVASTAGQPWTTDHAETPWDIRVGGEVMTVAAHGSLMNANPFMTTDAVGWAGSSSTITRVTDVVPPQGVASMRVTPNGTAASGGIGSVRTAVGTVTPGASYTAMGWVYTPAGHADLRAVIDWYDAANAFLSTGLGVATAVPAGSWTFLTQTLVAPVNTSRATVRMRHGGTPPPSAIWYAWGIRLIPAASVSATSPQTMSVIRSVNGISKAHSSGTDVRLATPTIVAL